MMSSICEKNILAKMRKKSQSEEATRVKMILHVEAPERTGS
jgi:hypothetical protein